ncbi:hypothetical protein [Tautonia plasticadhaerens]|uniref:Uncharacterized protein n=1 Tax=Tautonia plasticadhaerens TaxID=2527974 RepID=A0A518GXG8_9BACT|nr:hypothetical protein [Tautonia plasticadhaerens]QDV33279.1 hypothetical protein ElP_11220 [Tautonia plasticadhaerens]
MLTTPLSTRCLADRIRRAYLRRHPWWTGGGPDAPVWHRSALGLIQAHSADPRLPIDPELFVASQPIFDSLVDPWGDLVAPEAVARYRRRVSRIVRRLRDELRRELRLMRRRSLKGQAMEHQVALGGRGLSPLGRYVAAQRIGRGDLAETLRGEALRQHLGCPLYRLACRGLLSEGGYPEAGPSAALSLPLPLHVAVGWN